MFVEHRSNEFGMEKSKIPGDGVVTGWGTVNGRTVYLFAKDFTVFGGSLSETHAQKIIKVQDMAMKARCPIIGLFDAGGARIQEGVAALGGYGEVFKRNVLASGVIPQISVIMGPCAGGDVYSPAMTDFIFMVRDTSPHVRHRPGRREDRDQRGASPPRNWAALQCTRQNRGIADGAFENDVECLLQMRRLIDFLPANNESGVPEWPAYDESDRIDESLDTLIPDNPNKPYDMKELILKVADEGDFSSLPAAYARISSSASAASPAARLASSPTSRWCSPACSICDASRKAARFVRFCDAFGIPIVTLRGRARLPAGHRPGIWRADQARRQAPVRVSASARCRWSP
mgnify:CR=1 FL=1